MENLLKLKTSEKTRRPIFTIEGKDKVECLLDSGADLCVFTRGSKSLLRYFPDAILVDGIKALISGFGEGVDISDVYKIPEITLCDSWNKSISIKFENVLVACCLKDLDTQLILGAPLFGNVNYKIVNKDKYGKQVWIEYDRNEQYVVPVLNEKDKRVLESISVFALNELGA